MPISRVLHLAAYRAVGLMASRRVVARWRILRIGTPGPGWSRPMRTACSRPSSARPSGAVIMAKLAAKVRDGLSDRLSEKIVI